VNVGPELLIIPFGLLFVGSFIVWIWAPPSGPPPPSPASSSAASVLRLSGDRGPQTRWPGPTLRGSARKVRIHELWT